MKCGNTDRMNVKFLKYIFLLFCWQGILSKLFFSFNFVPVAPGIRFRNAGPDPPAQKFKCRKLKFTMVGEVF
jgi:hypothetical protein